MSNQNTKGKQRRKKHGNNKSNLNQITEVKGE